MKLRQVLIVSQLIVWNGVGIATCSTLLAQEKKIKKENLPAAVIKTVDEQSGGATVKGFSTETDKGKQMYEAELMVNGHSKDITMGADGSIVEVEEEVAMDSLTAEVSAGLKLAARGNRITKVESLTKSGKLVAYEAVVKKGMKNSEIQVGPDGKKLAHPE